MFITLPPNWRKSDKTLVKLRKSKGADGQTDPKVIHLERDWEMPFSLSKLTTFGNVNQNKNKDDNQM